MTTNNPFFFYSAQANSLFNKAGKQKNEALWLFNNKARVSFFMLESLCRLFDKWLEKPGYAHWHKAIKKLEDLLGEVDLYDTFIKEFSKNKKLSPDVLYYLQSKREKALKKFEKKLKKGGYLQHGMKEFTATIRSMHLQFDAHLVSAIEEALRAELKKLEAFAAENNYTYTELEDQVHELRRKLRWIGMYTQSLNGIIKLTDDGKKYKWEKKHLTKENLASPFNKFPKNGKYKKQIEFERKHFVALNHMIGELGLLKDKGINVELLAKAIRKTEHTEHNAAIKKSMAILGIKQTKAELVKEASRLAREFFARDKITSGLVYHRPEKISLDTSPPKFRLKLTIKNRKV